MFFDASKTTKSFLLSGNTSDLKLIILVFEGCIHVHAYVHASLAKHGAECIPTDASLQSSELGRGTHLCKIPAPFG